MRSRLLALHGSRPWPAALALLLLTLALPRAAAWEKMLILPQAGYRPAGAAGPALFNDAWMMMDYKTWAPAPDPIPWPARADFAAQVFEQRLYVMGGRTAAGPAADVWALDAPAQSAELAITPNHGFAAAGAPGGPFTPAAMTHTIRNGGGVPLNWQAAVTGAPWLSLSKTGGALPPGASDSVTVSINDVAKTLPAKKQYGYTGVLQFKNLASQSIAQVGLKLEVIPPK